MCPRFFLSLRGRKATCNRIRPENVFPSRIVPGVCSPSVASFPKPESVSDREETELDLVHRAQRGDEAAFAALADRYRDRVFGTASRFARGRHELEDLAQDIFLKVWKGLGSYREDAPFEHWFMRITVRTCYDFLRKHRRRRESEILVDETPVPRLPDHVTTEDRTRARREAWEVVQQLLDTLPEKDRLVVTLVDLERRSIKEASELTGWSESNVKVRAFRARRRMREAYESRELS